MQILRNYLNTLDRKAQEDFARRCGTTIGYMRKAISAKQKLSEALVISIERESDKAVPAEALRPDVDWGYIRNRPLPGSSSRSAKVA